jgi:pyruvate ferredoxin oxidoreductase gamma subunit
MHLLELRIHGRGGQGVVTLAELLARIAMRAGSYSQTMPQFGVERRGAAVRTSVRLSDEPIKLRSQSFNPDILVLMHENLLPAALADGEHKNALFVVSSRAPIAVVQTQWYMDAAEIAVKHNLIVGDEPYRNVPMLGALCRVLKLPQDLMKLEIESQWPGKKSVPNVAAALEAYETVSCLEGSGEK